MPLSMVKVGSSSEIKKITGKDETRKFLATLGFSPGTSVTVVSELAGSMILGIKGTRIALDKAMATRIIV